MKYFKTLFAVLLIGQLTVNAELTDNFTKGGWKLLKNTPGELKEEANKLVITDKAGKPGWVTASKSFDIDLDKIPVLVIKVAQVTKRATVKLIRTNPFEKKVLLNISRPGRYIVNIQRACKWNGKANLKVLLYAVGEEGKVEYSYLKFCKRPSAKELEDSSRKKAKVTIQRKPFELVPHFNTCSYYYKAPPKIAIAVMFREKNGKWKKALAPVWISEESMYRGSIVGLNENCEYEFKIISDGKMIAGKTFKTWSSNVPVAKKIVLNKKNFNGYLKITSQGKPNGWIKYTAAPGFVLKNDGKSCLLELAGAKYVLLDGLTLKGGDSSAIKITNCLDVRFSNCDISGWGIVGKQRFDKDGKFYNPQGRAINYNGGIYLTRSKNTVVERCYFHDPRNTANSWKYSHPAGPEGMLINKPISTVIRYNDFIGSDLHRWNDAVEGVGNFHTDGGFNADADIYGNMMAFGNDDGIEIDGGQQNVRVFMNKFEGFLCAVSIQGCMAGPSYVFRNLMVNMGDEFGAAGQIIKTSSHYAGKDAVSFILNNTITGDGLGLPLHRKFKIVAKNNIIASKYGVGGRSVCKKADADYNMVTNGKSKDEKNGIFGKYPAFANERSGLFLPNKSCSSVGNGLKVNNFTKDSKVDIGAFAQDSNLVLPYRPIPVYLDKYQLNFSVDNSKSAITQSIIATIGGKGFSSKYRIRKNEVFKWFTVSSASGVIKSGDKIKFNIELNQALMKERSMYKGMFLIRLANGYSRPVTIYAKTGVKQAKRIEKDGVFTLYIEAEESSGGVPYKVSEDKEASGGKFVKVSGDTRKYPAEYNFDIPEDGKYFVAMRVKSDIPVGAHNSLKYSIDNEDMKAAHMRSATSWVWTMSANNNQNLMSIKVQKLTKGKHTLKIMPREPIYLDAICITDNPKIFEHK